MPSLKTKYTTYLTPETAKALKRFAVERGYKECTIVEAALKKNIPERYFEDRYSTHN